MLAIDSENFCTGSPLSSFAKATEGLMSKPVETLAKTGRGDKRLIYLSVLEKPGPVSMARE
jgi:hypothetical protein